jgi:hypothetical protein
MRDDWATRATDTVERAVSVVRDKAVAPAQRATRAVVFGILASFFVLTALVLLVVGAFRGLVVVTGDVWIAYLICGGILVVIGAFAWSRRLKPPARPEDRA